MHAELAFQALRFLDTADRELINMRYIDEIGIKRMVEITGLKEKTLSSKLSRALKKYKQIYFALEKGMEVETKHGKKE
ncbi:MAG: sigma factor-like helix-turn-helix DNA-binding protein [Eubacteriales bacterium]|nr:sigma factor-like helix-turn-helix DNA-binding protein [Eubacteriales bacterium]MDD4389950.1 sigma factor-like helix-turn-helix DNA-binding protein [Eubacteriales bacterium]